ncbi:DEAD/DEAH box helicase family protein [Cuspidothrix issatschenkoi]|uniref:Restriction endonuclease subunit R n=1 Tax=Cuspidothrix issatschenkoi CHARLIE-1 TaxID=2052836 RepID=A0A2S6CWR4_9CYAN|nr:DEAD/DEAH box helicase family protein [Cuspidothrix issatschenkoi]PPJ64198.1 restriction endonuclease subunit R [Cuspidothrix issatschenkoi CHARLIE-1]
MSQFTFLKPEFPTIYESAHKAFKTAYRDPRTACFYGRRALELTVNWLYKYDNTLNLPYQDNISTLIHEPTFKNLVGQAIFNKAKLIIKIGNNAVHDEKTIPVNDSLTAVKEFFHIAYWLTRTYGRTSKPEPGLTFDINAIPQVTKPTPGSEKNKTPVSERSRTQELQKLETELKEKDEKLSLLLTDKNALDETIKQLRSELAAVKKENTSQADTHDYSEQETRNFFIDLLLKETGWKISASLDESSRWLSEVETSVLEECSLRLRSGNVSREYPVTGMPNNSGNGFVDYVLWGDDGKPLAVVEAKRTRKDPRNGQQQAKLYADCLEKQFNQRPLIFYTNGYEHWLWDDTNYPPRQVQGFYKKAELELLIQRRSIRRSLAQADIKPSIAERYYQTRAIRRVTEAIETDKERKALLVMATGAGKTRTAIALVEMLMGCNWVKRALFLADRVALVDQTIKVLKKHLPEASPVNLVTEKDGEGRVFACTYQTMMGLIDDTKESQKRFSVAHFDIIIVDEAHRSVFQKYRHIFNNFDALLLGLTATPKDEIDRNTYGLFDLESGVPTDAYGLEDAVKDGFLVPPQAVSVPLRFQRQGINYSQLSEAEREEWDAIEWDDEGNIPDRIEAAAVNQWLFNQDTVDKVLEHLMTRGVKVAGGDILGKTIIFAKNQAHANFIADRFNINYPQFKGEFARVITFNTKYAQSIIEDFSKKDKMPHIAISVDMLDTGIDVPEVVNLVMFKLVRSKTKFWQMLGRGTRRCADLFGMGQDKQFFYVFDYCQNLEFFQHNPETTDAPIGKSLSKQLFSKRLELIAELDQKIVDNPAISENPTSAKEPKTNAELRHQIANLLYTEVAAMNTENFIVRTKRQFVEKYANSESWKSLGQEDIITLNQEIAGLPSQIPTEAEETKRFDILILKLQLAIIKSQPNLKKLQTQVKSIAGLLEEKPDIPLIQAQLPLIQDIQSDEWWQDVTLPMLEILRKRLRGLVNLIEKQKRQPIYTNFEDEMGEEIIVELPHFTSTDNFAKFRTKARAFLRAHQDNIVIFKLRTNKQLTASDLSELERILAESGIGETEDINRAKEESQGLGLFVRSLVGLDREVAKQELAGFLSNKNLNANQIEFINMIINYLTEHGVMDAALLYESPFTDITPQGPDGLFTSTQVDELIACLEEVYQKAIA